MDVLAPDRGTARRKSTASTTLVNGTPASSLTVETSDRARLRGEKEPSAVADLAADGGLADGVGDGMLSCAVLIPGHARQVPEDKERSHADDHRRARPE